MLECAIEGRRACWNVQLKEDGRSARDKALLVFLVQWNDVVDIHLSRGWVEQRIAMVTIKPLFKKKVMWLHTSRCRFCLKGWPQPQSPTVLWAQEA